MRHKTVLAALAAIIIAPLLWGGPAQAPKPETRSLSLADCIRMALEGNLNLAIEALNPEMDSASVAEAREKYLPEFGLSSNYLNQDIPSSWGLEGPTIKTQMDYYQFGVTQRTPLGTELDLGLSTRKTDTSRAYPIVNPAFYSEFRLNLRQPLLRDFGFKANRYASTKAQRQLDVSEAALKTTLIQTVYSVEEAYWNLTYARESLRVLELSLDQSRETLKRNVEAARIGTKSAVEVLSAETEVAGYEDRILSARLQAEKTEDRLKALLNMPVAGAGAGAAVAPEEALVTLVPADKPEAEKRVVTLDDALATALAERPELARTNAMIANAATDVGYFKNQLLPRLDLNLSLWSPGQSGVKYVYLDDNPLTGIVIDTIIGSRGESFRDMFRMAYGNIQLAATLSVPLSNFVSRAGLARARLAQDQARLQFEKARQTIEVEVAEAVKDLEASATRIATSARYRELMEKRVQAETQRYDLGLVGSEWLFTYQRNLAQAKADEIRAVIDYKIALAALDKAMGTTIRAKGLKFKGYEF
ncbi:MAG TPA: TolC family protein [Candidatus Latescibacteria bacterium]|nr:TolC family protein [Candidatus Latescibacterota bacterium]